MRFTFGRQDRLRSETEISQLFRAGKKAFNHPFLCLYSLDSVGDEQGCRVVFSVPKRHYPKAVTRNLIKRRLKEIYRLNSHALKAAVSENSLQMKLLVVVVKTDNISYDQLEQGFLLTLQQLQGIVEHHNVKADHRNN